MIERFNFYDLYGYLIPGIVLVLSLRLPLVVNGTYPFSASEWIVLIVGVVLAYVLGHVVQTMASTALPSSRDPDRENWRYYSATILSPSDPTITERLKVRLEKGVKQWF